MLELIQAGGWLMIPILLCSVIAVAIIAERLWILQQKKVIPEKLLTGIWHLLDKNALTEKHINEIENGSPLGQVLAAGLINRHQSRDLIRESIEETGRHMVVSGGLGVSIAPIRFRVPPEITLVTLQGPQEGAQML